MTLRDALEIYVGLGKSIRVRSERIIEAERLVEPLLEAPEARVADEIRGQLQLL